MFKDPLHWFPDPLFSTILAFLVFGAFFIDYALPRALADHDPQHPVRIQHNASRWAAQAVNKQSRGSLEVKIMLLRDVHEEDAEALSQLLTHFTNLTTTPAQIRQRLARSQGIEHPILAELDGQVVGFASLRLLNYLGEDAPYAEISELFVLDPYRRRGIARALMSELEVRARAAGASSLAVLTAADNETAVALYRAMGFQEFSIALQKWFTEDRPYQDSQE